MAATGATDAKAPMNIRLVDAVRDFHSQHAAGCTDHFLKACQAAAVIQMGRHTHSATPTPRIPMLSGWNYYYIQSQRHY